MTNNFICQSLLYTTFAITESIAMYSVLQYNIARHICNNLTGLATGRAGFGVSLSLRL